MNCPHCRFWNSGDDHRCRRCGLRLGAPEPQPVHTSQGALAPAVHLAHASASTQGEHARSPRQRSLFPQKIVPINPSVAQPKPAPARPHRTRRRIPVSDQLQLDLLPAVAPASRKLKTSVEASVYCDAPVATPFHRAIASALDGAMILISAALFLATFHVLGGRFPMNKETALFAALIVGLLAFFYGAIWALVDRPTPGKRWTKLEIINFDGFPPDPRQRGLRFIGAWLSFCAVGLGLIWALVDEETLTWADHMSQTFSTFKEADNTPFRRL